MARRHPRTRTPQLWAVAVPEPWTPDNPDYQWLVDRHGDSIPRVLIERHQHDHAIGMPVVQWHTAIYRALVDAPTRPYWKRRDTFELADAIEAVYQLAPPHTPHRARNAIYAFYARLLASGLLDTTTQPKGGHTMNDWNPRCHLCGTTWDGMYGSDVPSDNPAARGWNITDDGIATCCDCEWRIANGTQPAA